MTITLSRKAVALAAVAGLVTVGAVSTVSYAAGTSANGVTACASSKGRLALTSSKGKCAKGFTKVTIYKVDNGERGRIVVAGSHTKFVKGSEPKQSS